MGPNRARPGGVLRTLIIGAAAAIALAASCSAAPPNQVTGIVTAIDGDLTSVAAFEVLADGRTWRFVPSPDGDYAFPLAHLRDHLRAGDPVIVEFTGSDDALVATAIRDG